VPWVLLSGGVDDATFEAQVGVASRGRRVGCRRGPLGMGGGGTHLGSVGTRRVAADRRDATGCAAWPSSSNSEARPWHDGSNRITTAPQPGDGWYRSVLSVAATERDIDILVVGEINPDIVVTDADPAPVFGQVERVVRSIR
jgi:hypothetical protein